MFNASTLNLDFKAFRAFFYKEKKKKSIVCVDEKLYGKIYSLILYFVVFVFVTNPSEAVHLIFVL